ncbi:ABC-type transport auxiliary lipoprotein family protein [Sphingomonas sp. CJ99]
MPVIRYVLIPALALPLAACVSLGGKAPTSLMTLEPTARMAAGQSVNSGAVPTITVAPPSVPQEIAVNRVPVRSDATTLAYVKDAQWVEPPAYLFQRLLSDTLAAEGGFTVLTARQILVDPGASLSGELRQFGVDARTNEAIVTYDAALVRKGAESIEKRRFETRVPVAAIEAAGVGAALNQAANQVAVDVARWAAGR